MEIHNHGNNLRAHLRTQVDSAATPAAGSSSGSVEAQPTRSAQLVEQLRETPEIRERLIVEIQAKVQSGEYLTRVAAERAAERLVD